MPKISGLSGKSNVVYLNKEAKRVNAEATFAEIQRIIHESDGQITPEAVLEALQMRQSINKMLAHLPELHQRVVRMRYGLESGLGEMSVEEIAHLLNKERKTPISSHRVRLIERVAMHRLIKQYAAELCYDMGWGNPLHDAPMLAAAARLQ